jgi:Cys-tRNA synthase (O-phospho-L-seryl-tRNA:Cys-tRNA synthase)
MHTQSGLPHFKENPRKWEKEIERDRESEREREHLGEEIESSGNLIPNPKYHPLCSRPTGDLQ